jgi:hypothetical protein
MMVLTREDMVILKGHFQAEDHRFLQGNAYITEYAITERLDEVDPAWSFELQEIVTRVALGGQSKLQVTAHGILTIKGVRRSGVGQTFAYESKPYEYTDKKSGEIVKVPSSEANEAEKSAATDALNAATDALKRAARSFGVGRYLLTLGKDVDNAASMKQWLIQNKPKRLLVLWESMSDEQRRTFNTRHTFFGLAGKMVNAKPETEREAYKEAITIEEIVVQLEQEQAS